MKETDQTCIKMIIEEKEIPIGIGDFVTILDDSDTVDVHVVKDLSEGRATITSLRLTEECDDIRLVDETVPLNKIKYIDDSFVNMNGVMWKARNKILEGFTFANGTIVELATI